jgi:hypothetical protein
MESFVSLAKAIQGHLENFNRGHKKEIEQHS